MVNKKTPEGVFLLYFNAITVIYKNFVYACVKDSACGLVAEVIIDYVLSFGVGFKIDIVLAC